MHKYLQRQFSRLGKLKPLTKLRVLLTVLVGVTVIALANYLYIAPESHQRSATLTTSNSKSVTHTTSAAPKVVKTTVTPAPAAAPPTKTVTTTAPAPVTSTKTTGTSAVVVPSPSSSVSSLTPSTTTPPSGGGTSNPPITSYSSTNWSGYLETSGTFSEVSASWTEPQVTGNGTTTSADGTWIGIGGVTTSDLIQVGTENSVAPNGQVTTSAFYELLPQVSQIVPGVTVTPGDSISASVTEVSSGEWTISLSDNTSGQTYSSTVGYASSMSSAEWIEEDPSYSRSSQIPFDNFGSVSFSGGSAIENGSTVNLVSGSAQAITMVNESDQAIATPSSIGGNGSSFSITQNSNN